MTYNGYTYEENTTRWREKWPPPKKKFSIRGVTATRKCRACGSTVGKIHRHHIAQDYFFACMRPDRYARTYLRFRQIDCNFLCRDCHDDIHSYRPYEKLKQMAYLEVMNRRLDGKRLRLTVIQCEESKRKLRKVYKKWLKRRRKQNGLSS